MNVTKEINNYIRDIGKGSMRDALNIALADIARLQGENARLLAQVRDREERLAMTRRWSPEILICKSCGGHYADGYLCHCGRDNSMSELQCSGLPVVRLY